MKYIFLDVDGVLNPYKLRFGGFVHIGLPFGPEGPGYRLNLHPDYGKWLTDLYKNTDSFLVWGSTWQQYANEWIGKPLDLPHLSHLDLSDKRFSETLGAVKGRKAIEYADGNRFVYFDDEPDIGYHINGSSGLHLVIDSREGLQPHHIIEAEKYLNN